MIEFVYSERILSGVFSFVACIGYEFCNFKNLKPMH